MKTVRKGVKRTGFSNESYYNKVYRYTLYNLKDASYLRLRITNIYILVIL
jgi:hypothetical protein